MFHHGALLLRLVDAVTEAFINHHLHRHAPVFERLPQLVTIRDRNALVEFAVLNQRRGLGLLDVGDRRRLLVDFRIVPRGRLAGTGGVNGVMSVFT